MLSFLVAVVVFPSGMDSENVRSDNLCGQSADSFTLGDCNVGWAYIVVIIGTVIEVVAFMLSWSPSKSRRRDTEYTFDI